MGWDVGSGKWIGDVTLLGGIAGMGKAGVTVHMC
jgi:hypothetical protein